MRKGLVIICNESDLIIISFDTTSTIAMSTTFNECCRRKEITYILVYINYLYLNVTISFKNPNQKKNHIVLSVGNFLLKSHLLVT